MDKNGQNKNYNKIEYCLGSGSIDPKIAFTIEEENNGQISFLDTLVSRKNGVTVIDVYRKPTHT